VADADEIWVIDTSSVNEVRRMFLNPQRQFVYDALTDLVVGGNLVFPTQVFDELDRFKNKNKLDQPFEWAKSNKYAAKPFEPLYTEVKDLLVDPQLSKVLDPDKPHEEADPYVLAMAEKISKDSSVGVLTQDRVSKPNKLSLSDACGLRRIVTLTMEPYLAQQGITP